MIERVYNKEKIKKIVFPLFNDVAEDDTSIDCFDLDVERDCWLSCDNYKGLFHVKAFNRTTLDLHCYVPKENRNKSKVYALSVIEWIREFAPSMYKKVITQVPSIYRHIRVFVLSVGFEKEGAYKKAFTKNGNQWDLNIYGLTL